jgi:hypothetical protein
LSVLTPCHPQHLTIALPTAPQNPHSIRDLGSQPCPKTPRAAELRSREPSRPNHQARGSALVRLRTRQACQARNRHPGHQRPPAPSPMPDSSGAQHRRRRARPAAHTGALRHWLKRTPGAPRQRPRDHRRGVLKRRRSRRSLRWRAYSRRSSPPASFSNRVSREQRLAVPRSQSVSGAPGVGESRAGIRQPSRPPVND